MLTELDLEKIVSVSMAYRALQIPGELLWLLKKILKLKERLLAVELGTCNGGTFFSLINLFDRVISIDMGKKELPFSLRAQDSYLIGNTQDPNFVKTFNNDIDFLLIDADHRIDGISKDFELWSPKIKKNGMIALHDINGAIGGDRAIEMDGVKIFWEKIKNNYKTEEIRLNSSLFGIGVIYI